MFGSDVGRCDPVIRSQTGERLIGVLIPPAVPQGMIPHSGGRDPLALVGRWSWGGVDARRRGYCRYVSLARTLMGRLVSNRAAARQ